MLINLHKIKIQNLLNILSDKEFEEILGMQEIAPVDLGTDSLFHISIGVFLTEILENTGKYISDKILCVDKNIPAVTAIGRLKTFQEEFKVISSVIDNCRPVSTDLEKAAAAGIVFPSFPEQVLLSVVQYFHLKSIAEAEALPFADYLLVLRSQSADAKYNRRYQQLISKKTK